MAPNPTLNTGSRLCVFAKTPIRFALILITAFNTIFNVKVTYGELPVDYVLMVCM